MTTSSTIDHPLDDAKSDQLLTGDQSTEAETKAEKSKSTEAESTKPRSTRAKLMMARLTRARSAKADSIKGGVAPFVPPANRVTRRLLLRRWQRRGFIPLSPGRAKIRHRILPRTVIGISFMLLSLAVGSAFSGAAFYAYYDNRLAENETTVARFVESFDQQFSDASGAIDDLRVEAIDDIREELVPLGEYVSDASGVINLPATVGESIWVLESRDEAGRPVVGSAFAVTPHRGGTAFITSFQLVTASTAGPAPEMTLIKDDRRLSAQLWAWDVDHDLAVVVVEDVIDVLPLDTDSRQAEAVGARVFAVSGMGGQGATASPGIVLDHADFGLQHTAAVGSFFLGGPLVTGDGTVVGMASLDYQPFGVDHGSVLAAPDIEAFCDRVLSCARTEAETTVIAATPTD